VPEESVAWLQTSIESDGPIEVRSTRSDQLFRDLSEEQVEALPGYKGELLLSTHGTGSYTSQALMKRLNRKNEQLADAAERASVVAHWLKAAPYPAAKLTDSWIRFLAKHFHDDLTGTGIPQNYEFSWNDEFVAQNRFASTLTSAVGGVARALDCQVAGQPLVVFNPLSISRQDVVEATVRFAAQTPDAVRVAAPDGTTVPAQVVRVREGSLDIVFVATVPSVGFSVYDVQPADGGDLPETDLQVDKESLENWRYRVALDDNGDIASIYDKEAGREMLSAPLRLAMFDDLSGVWPAWELLWEDVAAPPREYVSGPAEVSIVEEGPARVALEVRRERAGSTFVQRIRLGAGTAGERVEMEMDIDWWTQSTFLKLEAPLAVSNELATYDLGLGVIQRGNNHQRLYEVPAQQFADLTASDGSYGVSLLNDCKYGWDKPADDRLRLTLLHTPFPMVVSIYYGQDTQDLGTHRLAVALYGHDGGWRNGSVRQAARFNQPLRAFQTTRHPGPLGRDYSFVSVDNPAVAVVALKLAEEGDEVIMRLVELTGEDSQQATVRVGGGLSEARELNGGEQDLGPAEVTDGMLVVEMPPFGMATFGLTPAPPEAPLSPPECRPVPLPLDTDVVSTQSNPTDGVFGKYQGISYAYPAELFPATIDNDGIVYQTGSGEDGQVNALTCAGQTIPLDPKPGDRLFLLAAGQSRTTGVFTVGEDPVALTIEEFTGNLGQGTGRVDKGKVIMDPKQFKQAFVKQDNLAWYGTHRHGKDGDDYYRFVYLFQYELPVPEMATSVTLSGDERIRIFAMTLAADHNGETVPATPLYDHHEPRLPPFAPDPPEDPFRPNPEPQEDMRGMFDTMSDNHPGGTGKGGGCGCNMADSDDHGPVWLLLLALLVVLRTRRPPAGTCRAGTGPEMRP